MGAADAVGRDSRTAAGAELAPEALLDRLRELERDAAALDPDASERRRLRDAVVSTGERFLDGLGTVPAYQETDDRGSGLLRAPISENARPIEEILALFEHDVVRPGGLQASGRYMAYIPGSGAYPAALGDYLAAVCNKYSGIFFTGPGAVRMEYLLTRWVADLVGYPATAGGHIASGGSLATLAALATARDAHGLQGAGYAKSVVYLTEQTHHCVDKALRLIGMAEAPVRRVAMDERYRMRPEALAAAIAADRAGGLRPWLVAAAAGTTDTGAVDPLAALGEIAKREGCWYHVDAAYGGFFLLTDEGRRLFRGIELSDSVILDPHKGLFIPFGAGMLIVRDVQKLVATHDVSGHYMQDARRDSAEISPTDLCPEQSRHFRALRIWLPLLLLGTKPFQAALEEKLLLARYFHREIEALGFEVGPTPELSVVTYRWAPKGASLERTNAMNQAIVEGVRKDGRVFLSSTMLEGRFTLRLAVLSFRTHRKEVDLALQVLAEQAAALGE
jgi:glutamate/tyrosine decarboxylase-like PLP-dependent enzyme